MSCKASPIVVLDSGLERPRLLALRFLAGQMDEDLHGLGEGEVLDDAGDVLLGVRVQVLLVEGGGVEGVEDLHDGPEPQLDEDGAVLDVVVLLDLGHGAVYRVVQATP